MRDEIAVMYDGLELDGDTMPKAGQAELSPPTGAFLVGSVDGDAVCCGVSRFDTGPRQGNAQGLYESEGYVAIDDFNGNPVAVFWGEKPLIESRSRSCLRRGTGTRAAGDRRGRS
jgi:hypothetical protein